MAPRRLRLAAYLPYRLSVTAHHVSSLIGAAYRPLALPAPQWRVLALLHEHGTLTQQQLVPLSTMDKQTVSRAVRALQRRGLLRRAVSQRDARAFELRLSASGERLHRRVSPLALAYERQLTGGMSAREIAQLRRGLAALEASARRLSERQERVAS